MEGRVFRISIAGCGKVAHMHARAVKNIMNAELAGVWSRTYGTAARFAEEFSTRAYSDITAMVTENNVDLVIVCTPHPFHRMPAIEAARAGASVLVEKPLASDLDDCDAIIKACRSAGVRLGVISQRRWYPPVQRMKMAVDSGKIGKPVLATATILGWRDKAYYDSDAWRGRWDTEGGGILVNQSPHHLDLLLWFMGEVEEVFGVWRNFNHPYIEVDDTAVAIVRFKSGAVGNIVVSNSQKPGIYGKLHIHGDNGSSVGVQTDGGAMFIAGMTGILEPPVNDIWTIPGEEGMLKEWAALDTDFFNSHDPVVFFMQQQIEDFLTALATGRDPLVTGEDGRRTVELFTSIYRSEKTNSVIRFPLEYNKEMDIRSKD